MSAPLTLPDITEQDRKPARLLWTELETRIATQRLHYRSGDEETADKSLYDLFKQTRALMAEHWEAVAFATAAIYVLNDILRPNTARWHRWIVDGKFADERLRRQFRYELQLLQPRLIAFRDLLGLMAALKTSEAKAVFAALGAKQPANQNAGASPPPSPGQDASLGGKIHAGIAREVPLKDGPLHADLGAVNFATAADIDLAEHQAILARRNALIKEDAAAQNPPVANPPLENAPLENATGLCLSGGGIRSATFCLGIVQVLARQGLLARFDYLSTVSGGGYLGAFLTAYLGTPPEVPAVPKLPADAKRPDEVPAAPKDVRKTIESAFASVGGLESAAVRHLRNNSRYLISGGLWARLKMFGLVVSGILTNILLMLPLPLGAVLVVSGLAAGGYWSPGWTVCPSLRDAPAFCVFAVLGIVLVAAWLLLPIVRSLARGATPNTGWARLRTFWESSCVILGVIALAAGALVLVPAVFNGLAAVRNGVVGHMSSALFERLAKSEIIVGIATALAPVVFGLLAAHSKPGTRKKKWTTFLFAMSGPLLALAVFLIVGNRTVGPNKMETWPIFWVGIITAALTLWGWLFADLNEFSPHRYYRNRLCECYLAVRQASQRGKVRSWIRKLVHGREKGETFRAIQVGTLRQLPLSQMNATGAAPYHLVNTAANLPASLEPNLRGRDCDFFSFSHDYCGGPVCGYIKTTTLETLDPHVDLGTAMAVSGAAASSNMGVKTMRHMRFLLALLNIRLGYWLRNPIAGLRHLWNVPGPQYLLREMMGWMHEKTAYLNLSDGGHIENLALYEMLRRRCKFIVVIDGGQEPGMECADLMLAMRYAQIDLGVRLELDLADLALNAERRSRAYAVFGKVHYSARADGKGANDLGWLIYFKLARTGSEPGYVMDYARQNPDFPHQTTGDQIYDEAQFEAYRRLGECAAESLFRPEISDPYFAGRPDVSSSDAAARFKTLDEWFQSLANSLLVDNDPAFDAAK